MAQHGGQVHGSLGRPNDGDAHQFTGSVQAGVGHAVNDDRVGAGWFGLYHFGQDVGYHQRLVAVAFDGGRTPVQRDDADVGARAGGIGVGAPGVFCPARGDGWIDDANVHGCLLLQRDPGVKHRLPQV